MSPSNKAKVFFPRDQHLASGNCPAWYKFWAKNQGGPGMHQFNGTSKHDGVTITWKYSATLSSYGETGNLKIKKGYLRNTYYADIALGPMTVSPYNFPAFSSPQTTIILSTGVSHRFPLGHISLPEFRKSSYETVDGMLHTERHELQHVKRWYDNNVNGIPSVLPPLFSPPIHTAKDRDGDWLPDTFEDTFGTNWNNTVTHSWNVGGYDDEIECEQTARTPTSNINSNEDWAFPGKQWY
jgi:hypothetical protein